MMGWTVMVELMLVGAIIIVFGVVSWFFSWRDKKRKGVK